MSEALSVLRELPAGATNAEALAWVRRMRRILDRWESFPGHAESHMTPETRQRAYRELEETEALIQRNMT